MSDLEVFKQFVNPIYKKKVQATEINCVIYTRVSTREQAENNMSLDTQLKACEQYARSNGYNVLSSFGGTFESAKTDERKQFKKMLDFVRRSKEKVSYIIVYSVDRFSRTGANGMFIASELRKQGISVQAVSQPSDTATASGRFQQNIHFIFSEYDNELRRDKAVTGMREKLNRGYWINRMPIGYDNIKINGEPKVVVNETGKLIKKAFEWKRREYLSDIQILDRLSAFGLHLKPQTLFGVMRNPFYCGIIKHGLLGENVVQGRHESLISKELFLEVNEILARNTHGYKCAKESEPHPLRKFLKCAKCGTSFAGYVVKKKGLHYYKCAKKGCKCNRNADRMHEMFLLFLSQYAMDKDLFEPFKEILIETFQSMNEENENEKKILSHHLAEINTKIETFEERYGLGEISKEIFLKYTVRYREEKKVVEKKLAESAYDTSNLDNFVNDSLEIAHNMHKMWNIGNYKIRETLQFLVFPEGILYDRKINGLRTQMVNPVFQAIACLSDAIQSPKNKKADASVSLSNLVGVDGFEPPTLCL